MTMHVVSDLTIGNSSVVSIKESGKYFIAVTGEFHGATASVFVNIGETADCIVTDSSFTEDGTKVMWLPTCTLYVGVAGEGAATSVNASIALLEENYDRV